MVATALVLYRPLPGTAALSRLPPRRARDRLARPATGAPGWIRWSPTWRSAGRSRCGSGHPSSYGTGTPATVTAGIADPDVRHVREVPAAGVDGYALDAGGAAAAGWGGGGARRTTDSGFGLGQPRYGCHIPLAGRSVDELRGALAPHFEQSLRTAESAGVRVSWGSAADLPDFYRLYAATAAHDGFRARPPVYFRRMWEAMNAEDADRLRLYLAEYDGEVLSAALMINVGSRVWHSYAASGRRGRELRPSSALLWRMLCDARAAGAETYDLRR